MDERRSTPLGDADVDPLVDVEFDDPRFDALDHDELAAGGRDIHAVLAQPEPGFPAFHHGQFTVEGEIERFGAFGRAGAAATGWKRVVAVVLALALLTPIAIGAVGILAGALSS